MKRIAWFTAVLMALSFPLGAHALNKKLTERYQTADELVTDLRNLKRKLEVSAELSGTLPDLRVSKAKAGCGMTCASV